MRDVFPKHRRAPEIGGSTVVVLRWFLNLVPNSNQLCPVAEDREISLILKVFRTCDL